MPIINPNAILFAIFKTAFFNTVIFLFLLSYIICLIHVPAAIEFDIIAIHNGDNPARLPIFEVCLDHISCLMYWHSLAIRPIIK